MIVSGSMRTARRAGSRRSIRILRARAPNTPFASRAKIDTTRSMPAMGRRGVVDPRMNARIDDDARGDQARRVAEYQPDDLPPRRAEREPDADLSPPLRDEV